MDLNPLECDLPGPIWERIAANGTKSSPKGGELAPGCSALRAVCAPSFVARRSLLSAIIPQLLPPAPAHPRFPLPCF